MEMKALDLDAYCARIGYDGPREPTLATLRALHALHPAAIAFEALDVMLGRGIDLAPAAVEAKLVHQRRGGYCFEQNGLFQRVLAALGFEVEALLARVLWRTPADAPPRPRTHMALRVMVEGEPWLADVGFGGCVMTAPLRMGSTAPQPTGHEDFRLTPAGRELILSARMAEGWEALCSIAPEPQLDVDFMVANWFTATHPDSPFRSRLMVARSGKRVRYGLLDNRLTIRSASGVEQQFLDADQMEAALRDLFHLPVDPAWRPVLESVARGAAA